MPGTKKKQTTEERWTSYAKERLVGRKIIETRYLTEEEAAGMDWYSRALVLVLDDGTVVFPSSSDEGDGPGALFGNGPTGEELTFPVI